MRLLEQIETIRVLAAWSRPKHLSAGPSGSNEFSQPDGLSALSEAITPLACLITVMAAVLTFPG